PTAALPVPLRGYVEAVAAALGCDPSYIALPVLAVAASAVGATRALRLKGGWEEFAIVWAAVVADSGTLKTPAYIKAAGHLFRVPKRLLLEFNEALVRYEEEQADYDARKKAARNGKGDPGEKPVRPTYRRVLCADVTIEKLAEVLEDNPRGILVARD